MSEDSDKLRQESADFIAGTYPHIAEMLRRDGERLATLERQLSEARKRADRAETTETAVREVIDGLRDELIKFCASLNHLDAAKAAKAALNREGVER